MIVVTHKFNQPELLWWLEVAAEWWRGPRPWIRRGSELPPRDRFWSTPGWCSGPGWIEWCCFRRDPEPKIQKFLCLVYCETDPFKKFQIELVDLKWEICKYIAPALRTSNCSSFSYFYHSDSHYTQFIFRKEKWAFNYTTT
jgi:hypothetical protein